MNAPCGVTSSTLPNGEVLTFYSYKGGTGRSMLLANVAWQLAAAGRRVLVIDWDLEAPGLHRYFKPFLGNDPELREQEGVIEWVTEYWDAFLEHPGCSVDTLVRDFADPRHYVRKLDTSGYDVSGGIDLLCAGRQNKRYAETVADFDWTQLYQKLHGEQFIDVAKSILVGSGGYDYILVDARTGVSDTSGFCTVALADTLVVCFTYNNQSVIGASQIARDIKRQAESRRQESVNRGAARRFRVFAVPSRVDDMDPDRLERRQKHAWKEFADLLKDDIPPSEQEAYWLRVQIRNQGLFAYEEVLAVCMNHPTDPQSVLGAVTQLTRALTNGAFFSSPALRDDQRQAMRDHFGQFVEGGARAVMRDAWESFIERTSDVAARESLLQACFPLLVQLVAHATSSEPAGASPAFLRTMVLEAELTAEERRMADVLISVGIAQRRIDDDRSRGLTIADESILNRWDSLRERLHREDAFIAARERVRQARRSWEASGRTIAALQALQGEFAQLHPSDEQRAWMGRPNLQFLEAMQEWKVIEVTTRQDAERIERMRKRIEEMEANRAQADKDFLNVNDSLRRETVTAERRRVISSVMGIVTFVLFGGSALGGWELSRRANEQQAILKAEAEKSRAESAKALADAIEQAATARAKVAELERQRSADAAFSNYGKGQRQLQNLGNPRSKDYDKKVSDALDLFNQAIKADPMLADAYKGRALARGNFKKNRDVFAEMSDWAEFLRLKPSLNGRLKVIREAVKHPEVGEAFLANQIAQLVAEAKLRETRDASPRAVAKSLGSLLTSFPRNLQPQVRAAIDSLGSLPESIAFGEKER